MKPTFWLWLGALTLGGLGARYAFAAPIITCCASHGRVATSSLTLGWSTGSFGAFPAWTAQFQTAAQTWTSIPESSVNVTAQADSNGVVALNNSENEIWYNGSTDIKAIAATYIVWSMSNPPGGCGIASCPTPICNGCTAPTILAADIIFFGVSDSITQTWNTGTPTGANTLVSGSAAPYVQEVAVHEMGHAIGLDHVADGMQRMSPAAPNGGWFNGTISSASCAPLADDHAVAYLIYPALTSYSDFYASNCRSLNGSTRELASVLMGTPPTAVFIYPDNLATVAQNASDNHARRGQSVGWKMCYGNLGNANTGALTISATLSTSPTTMGTLPFGSLNLPSGVAAGSTACQTINSVVPSTATIGTNYYIVFGSGTGANDIAREDRRLLIDP